jgi:hypothetical protein
LMGLCGCGGWGRSIPFAKKKKKKKKFAQEKVTLLAEFLEKLQGQLEQYDALLENLSRPPPTTPVLAQINEFCLARVLLKGTTFFENMCVIF